MRRHIYHSGLEEGYGTRAGQRQSLIV